MSDSPQAETPTPAERLDRAIAALMRKFGFSGANARTLAEASLTAAGYPT